MKILVIGATGLLGRNLLAAWAPTHEVTGVGSRQCDIRDAAQVGALLARVQPDVTVLAAAITDVEGCERDPELAYAINAAGPEHVARACAAAGSRLVHISTDYVFDGEKGTPYEVDDPKRPLSHYARSKSEGEDRVLAALPAAAVVRVAWLFGNHPRAFPDRVLAQAATQREITAIADKFSTPTFAPEAAAALLRLMEARAAGIFHVTNAGGGSWYDIAAEVLRAAGIEHVRLVRQRLADLGWKAPRPRNSVLSLRALAPFGIVMRPWQEAVGAYIRQVTAAASARVTA